MRYSQATCQKRSDIAQSTKSGVSLNSQYFSDLAGLCVCVCARCLYFFASDLIVPVWGSACQTSSSSHTSETWTVDKHSGGLKATQLSH